MLLGGKSFHILQWYRSALPVPLAYAKFLRIEITRKPWVWLDRTITESLPSKLEKKCASQFDVGGMDLCHILQSMQRPSVSL